MVSYLSSSETEYYDLQLYNKSRCNNNYLCPLPGSSYTGLQTRTEKHPP